MPSSPPMHTAGLANSLPFQMLGGRCVTLHNRRFDPLELWRVVARERVMCMVIVGEAFARPMLDALEEARARGATLERLLAEDGREIPKGSTEPGLIAAGGAALPARETGPGTGPGWSGLRFDIVAR